MSNTDIVHALVLGVIQGLTEFLPVSSSAHLIIVSELQSGKVIPLSFNVAMHLGTVTAAVAYFWRDWLRMTHSLLPGATATNPDLKGDRHLLLLLFLGSIPAGVIGMLFKDHIESVFHHPMMTVLPLAGVGILLWYVDEKANVHKQVSELSIKDTLIVGIAQACALIPGTSRSGATIIGGRLAGLSRFDAARFSFLLGTPAMLGAAVLDANEIIRSLYVMDFWVGVLTAALVGFLAIHLLLGMVRRWSFLGFAIYRLGLAAWVYFIAAM